MSLPEWAANMPVAEVWGLVVILAGVSILLAAFFIATNWRLMRAKQEIWNLKQQVQQTESKEQSSDSRGHAPANSERRR